MAGIKGMKTGGHSTKPKKLPVEVKFSDCTEMLDPVKVFSDVQATLKSKYTMLGVDLCSLLQKPPEVIDSMIKTDPWLFNHNMHKLIAAYNGLEMKLEQLKAYKFPPQNLLLQLKLYNEAIRTVENTHAALTHSKKNLIEHKE